MSLVLHTENLNLSSADIRYFQAGSGKFSLIICPDPPNTIEHYHDLIKLLSIDFQVVVFELPGFGFSKISKSQCISRDFYTQITFELIERLNLKNVILVYPCLSALSAIQAAHLRPDLIYGLVIIQCGSISEEQRWAHRIDVAGLFKTPIIGDVFSKFCASIISKKWYQSALPKGSALFNSFWGPTNEAFKKGARFPLSSAIQSLLKMNTTIHEVKQPALILWGGSDRSHRYTNKRSLLEWLVNAQYHEWPNCGHFPELEHTKKFAELIQKYFKNTCSTHSMS